mgnify:CR=1 FL=1
MLMYTSCGWFFDDISGLESVFVLRQAGRVIDLARRALDRDLEPAFLEILGKALTILNTAETPPFQIDEDDIGEELRLRYRYIDLRRPQMQQRILTRNFSKTLRLMLTCQQCRPGTILRSSPKNERCSTFGALRHPIGHCPAF